MRGRRLAWLDTLRGVALLGMVAYHGAWDMHAFGLIATDPSGDVRWRALGSGVAALFLLLSGFGLSLAARQGTSPQGTWLRIGRIATAAALVTAVTRWAVPEAPIWFGILHCIAVTNVLALAVRSAPTLSLLVAGAAACAAPFTLQGALGSGWAWTGLAAVEPAAMDFRPVLPWLAPVLIGVALGRTTTGRLWTRLPRFRPLAWAGRHSLPLYLLHQPILLGLLAAVPGTMPRDDATPAMLRQPGQAAAFLQQCRSACLAKGGEQELCASTCHCVLTAALSQPVMPRSGWMVRAGRFPRALDAAVALCERIPAPEGQ